MKNLAYATLAALAIAAISGEQARAWFNFGVGGSANLNLSCGGKTRYRCDEPWPNTYGTPAFNYYGAAGGVPSVATNPPCMSSYYNSYWNGDAYPASFAGQANPSYLGLQPVPSSPYTQTGYQPAGYGYFGYYVPGYWYGR